MIMIRLIGVFVTFKAILVLRHTGNSQTHNCNTRYQKCTKIIPTTSVMLFLMLSHLMQVTPIFSKKEDLRRKKFTELFVYIHHTFINIRLNSKYSLNLFYFLVKQFARLLPYENI